LYRVGLEWRNAVGRFELWLNWRFTPPQRVGGDLLEISFEEEVRRWAGIWYRPIIIQLQ
jgi:hypothetical protein